MTRSATIRLNLACHEIHARPSIPMRAHASPRPHLPAFKSFRRTPASHTDLDADPESRPHKHMMRSARACAAYRDTEYNTAAPSTGALGGVPGTEQSSEDRKVGVLASFCVMLHSKAASAARCSLLGLAARRSALPHSHVAFRPLACRLPSLVCRLCVAYSNSGVPSSVPLRTSCSKFVLMKITREL